MAEHCVDLAYILSLSMIENVEGMVGLLKLINTNLTNLKLFLQCPYFRGKFSSQIIFLKREGIHLIFITWQMNGMGSYTQKNIQDLESIQNEAVHDYHIW